MMDQAGSGPARVSVLICSRDRPGLLADTVRSVLEGCCVPGEIIVVDQSVSADSELAGLGDVRGCHVRYLHSSTVGASVARNVGLGAAANEVVVLLDDDMLVEHRWLAELLAGLPERPRVIATGRVLAAPPEGAEGTVPPAALVERDEPAVFRGVQELDVVPGANVAIPRDAMLELGGYDERLGPGTRFGSAEDNDMGYRLLMAGCEVHHVPSAIALHRAWRTRPQLVRLRWRYGRGKGAFYAKHAGLRDRRVSRRAALEIAGRLRRAAGAVFASPRTTAAELLSVIALASGAVSWLLRERLPGLMRGRGH